MIYTYEKFCEIVDMIYYGNRDDKKWDRKAKRAAQNEYADESYFY